MIFMIELGAKGFMYEDIKAYLLHLKMHLNWRERELSSKREMGLGRAALGHWASKGSREQNWFCSFL